MEKIWTHDEISKILKKDVSEKYESFRLREMPYRSIHSIKGKVTLLKKQGFFIDTKSKFWTPEEDDLLRNKSPDQSWTEFIQNNLSHRTYKAALHRANHYLNIEKSRHTSRKYFFKKDIWENASSPEVCYWGGFLAGDGSIYKNKKFNWYSLSVILQKSDEDHLFKLKEFVNYTGPIGKAYKDGNSSLRRLKINCGHYWHEALKENFSIVPNKTHILSPPKIFDTNLIFCYLCGLIDADGHISFLNGKLSLSIVMSSPDLAAWIGGIFKEFSSQHCFIKQPRKLFYEHKTGCKSVVLSGLSACAFIDYIRQLPIPRMTRKWDKPPLLSYIQKQKSLYPDKFLIYSPNSL